MTTGKEKVKGMNEGEGEADYSRIGRDTAWKGSRRGGLVTHMYEAT